MVMSKLNKKASASFTGLTVKQKTALTGAGLKPIIKGEGGENKFVTLKDGLIYRSPRVGTLRRPFTLTIWSLTRRA